MSDTEFPATRAALQKSLTVPRSAFPATRAMLQKSLIVPRAMLFSDRPPGWLSVLRKERTRILWENQQKRQKKGRKTTGGTTRRKLTKEEKETAKLLKLMSPEQRKLFETIGD